MPPRQGQRITIRGTVQGVGFRPFIWRLATVNNIVGRVWNDGAGVVIDAWGEAERLKAFFDHIQQDAPPLARITEINACENDGTKPTPQTFQIMESTGGEIETAISPDAATCPDCLAEIFDPYNRRYRYPFTNCTHCGPRFSIVHAIPYDRDNTSMSPFAMCPSCEAEYRDPTNRRFHAQANCCPECGPRVWLESGGARFEGEVIERAVALIREGKILGIKGIGGFHLACAATNEKAIERLRQRKQRPDKPFALMARDLEMVRVYAEVSELEAAQLTSTASPIVLLQQKNHQLPEALAPGLNTLGCMLPYTPLHHLLLAELNTPLVLTSANRSGEPLVCTNDEARECLSAIADGFLLHDREIVHRLDDSVVRVINERPRVIRRARGYAPQPIKLPPGFENKINILAMGAEMKGSFCLVKNGEAILSQYIGDLKGAATYRHYRESIARYLKLYDFTPERIVVDRHPDYLSTQWGRRLATEMEIPIKEVQHHHAHITAVMAEHGVPADGGKVLGVALDGLGFGDDGTLWGGEFLLAEYSGYTRLAHFEPVAMPGGNRAIVEPWRNTFAQLDHYLGWESVAERYGDLELIEYLAGKPVNTLKEMTANGINSPLSSSAGRLFDAVAVALGNCREGISYDGQAAIELEVCCGSSSGEGYGYDYVDGIVGWRPMWEGLLDDLKTGVRYPVIASRFHQTVAQAVVAVTSDLCLRHSVERVVLSGGVFQNALLLGLCVRELRRHGLVVLTPGDVPGNDGGLGLGQGMVVC